MAKSKATKAASKKTADKKKECRLLASGATSLKEALQVMVAAGLDINKKVEMHHDRGTDEFVFSQAKSAAAAPITEPKRATHFEKRGVLTPLP